MEQRTRKTADIKFLELCDEIDFWKQQAHYYKEQYEEEVRLNMEASQRSLKVAQEGVANALMFALSVKDNPDGSLSISKEDRKSLAENYK